MGVLEQIMNLKSQGKPEREIIQNLQSQGVSPKEITSAFNQAQVKNEAINQYNNPHDGMQPSIMQGGEDQLEEPEPPTPNDQQKENFYTPQQEQYVPQMQAQGFQPYPSQGFQNDLYQPAEYESSSYSTDTMIDVAEQVFAEKMSLISKQLDTLKELKTLTESRLIHIEERLRQVESVIDNLQLEILKKVGSYGENLQSIKNEMSMMQNSFGKIINPLVEKNSQSFNSLDKTRKR